MQTVYSINPDIYMEGQPQGPRSTRPLTLAWLAQQDQVRIANSEAGTLTFTLVDDLTEQSYTLDVTISGAVEATSLDEMVAAWQANSAFNALASVTEDGVDDMVVTYRHANRSYTLTTSPPGSMTAVVSELQASGGSGLEMGRVGVQGADDNTFDQIEATSVLDDIVGVLFRTDANHFHLLEGDIPTAVDTLDRGRTHDIMTGGRVAVRVEEAVTPASPVYVRRALTSGAGRLGGFRGSPDGGQQTYTFTPSAVDLPGYGFEFEWRGVHYTALYLGDGSTTVAVACDGLVQDLGTIAGLTITDDTTHVSIQTAAGEQLENVRNLASQNDTPADSVTIAETVAADIDTIDVSSIMFYETSAAQDGMALVRVKIAGV